MCFFGNVYRLLEISRLSDLNGLFELFWAAFACFTVLPARLKYFGMFYNGILLLRRIPLKVRAISAKINY